jgi:hypothetical protein
LKEGKDSPIHPYGNQGPLKSGKKKSSSYAGTQTQTRFVAATKQRFAPLGNKNKNTEGIVGVSAQANDTYMKLRGIFDGVPKMRTVSPPRKKNPRIRFRERSHDVSLWGATDFVVYYSLLYRRRYGEEPALDWARECGAARNLLARLHTPDRVKVFLQVSFAVAKFKPKGVSSFTFSGHFDSVLEKDVTPALIDDYEDEEVFPWLSTIAPRNGLATKLRKKVG